MLPGKFSAVDSVFVESRLPKFGPIRYPAWGSNMGLPPRLKAVAGWFVLFNSQHWRGLSLFALAVSIFCWTNWFFSAQARFERLSKTVLARTSDRLYSSAEERRLRETVGYFGERDPSGVCGPSICSVTYDLEFRWDPDFEKSVRPSILVSVTARLQPQFSDMRALGLLPPAIEWREVSWDWSVTYTAKDGDASQFSQGSWRELNKIPRYRDEDVLRALAIRMAQTIREELLAQTSLAKP
jgi:hypothetical protein